MGNSLKRGPPLTNTSVSIIKDEESFKQSLKLVRDHLKLERDREKMPGSTNPTKLRRIDNNLWGNRSHSFFFVIYTTKTQIKSRLKMMANRLSIWDAHIIHLSYQIKSSQEQILGMESVGLKILYFVFLSCIVNRTSCSKCVHTIGMLERFWAIPHEYNRRAQISWEECKVKHCK